MNRTTLLAAAIAILASLPFMARPDGAHAQAGGSAQPAVSPADGPAAANQAPGAAERMRPASSPVSGELAARLDTKSVRVGAPVVLKITHAAHIAAGVELPKGSQLQGHVTEVQAHDKTSEAARVRIEFDRAVSRNGQSFAIRARIESVSLPAGVLGQERTRGWGLSGPGPAGTAFAGQRMGGTATSGTQMAGHGLVVDAVLLADADGGQMHSNIDESATGIPDVTLSSDPTGKSAGILSSAKKNFRLDAGTQMVVGISALGK
jgi:hypothetical protein